MHVGDVAIDAGQLEKDSIEALAHYSGGTPKCAEPGCLVDDPDMLCLHRKGTNGQREHSAAMHLLRSGKFPWTASRLRARGYPDGYVVLCANHMLGNHHKGGD